MLPARFHYEQKKFVAPFLHRYQDAADLLFNVTKAVKKFELNHGRHSSIARNNAALAASNKALREMDARLKIHDLNLSWCDESICRWCRSMAEKCANLSKQKSVQSKVGTNAKAISGLLSESTASVEIERLLNRYGFIMPLHDLFGLPACIARTCDERWWRRQVRRKQAQVMDQIARDLRTVHRRSMPYCANTTVTRRLVQKNRNRELLKALEAVNNEGDAYTLAELSELSVSTPAKRRAELMVRMRGFEEVAQDYGHTGLFITTSAPSEYHPCREIRNKKGRLIKVVPNPNYTNKTPRDAQDYHCKTWAGIRAELARREIGVYGFRVTEPHHDGTPHWHLMLFTYPEYIDAIKRVFTDYCLRESPDEKGARKYRVRFVDMDPKQGTATGYIAKYISKNIDGYAVGHDNNAELFANESAQRIEAWAATWSLRQFQQIGGPSVTVWRELRRLNDHEGPELEPVRAAADSANWRAYVHLMGGPFCGREGQPIRAARWQPINTETGEIDCLNRYGEESKGSLFGLKIVKTGEYVLTRFYQWVVKRIEACQRTTEQLYEEWFFANGPPLATLDLCQ